MKRLLALPALILLTATCQDAGRITQPDGDPFSELPAPNFAVTTAASGAPSVSAAGTHNCGLTTAGAAFCWGQNQFGQLGDGTLTNSNVPVAVLGGLIFESMSGARTSGSYNCGVTTTGAAYCWGLNSLGMLGNGTTTDSNVPVAVSGGLTFQSVSAGAAGHACGLTTTNGAAYCWGFNARGQLGNGTNTDSNEPVLAVSGGLTFQSVSTGGQHSCGVTTTGAAYCWGLNSRGELGNGTTTDSNVPVAVSGGLTFGSVSAGFERTCGLTMTGAAYCWGRNHFGQLGDGTTAGSSLPVMVSGGLTFQSVSAGRKHNCGVTSAGAAYCWGGNSAGMLGNGTTTDSNVPVAVSGGLAFQSVSAGGGHSCGLTTARIGYCWGQNALGTLGDGTNTNSLVPVLVDLVFGPPPDTDGPVTTNTTPAPNPVGVGLNVDLTANVDDATTGGSNIASAEYSLDGGSTWSALSASDGTFDEVSEDVGTSFFAPALANDYDLCVRGTDDLGNVGAPECTTLAVQSAGAGPGDVYIYVSNFGSDDVSVINTANNLVVARIAVGTTPQQIAMSPDRSQVFVANSDTDDVSVISTADNRVTATVDVGAKPWGVAVTPDGESVYITNSSAGTVTVLDAQAPHNVEATVSVGGQPLGVAVTPDGASAYVVRGVQGDVKRISTATHLVDGTLQVGLFPRLVSFSPNGAFAYVANQGQSDDVSKINTATFMVEAIIPIPTPVSGNGAFEVALTPDGTTGYVSNLLDNNVAVINTATNMVTETITVGTHPQGLKVTPEGDFLYVSHFTSNDVYVISTATNDVVTTISANMGTTGRGLAMPPFIFVDDQGPVATAVNADPNPVGVGSNVDLTANVDDGAAGGSNIASTEYSLDGGAWAAMAATDGGFDGASEDVEASFNAPALPGDLSLCVRGTDDLGNVGAPDCITLVVQGPGTTPVGGDVEVTPDDETTGQPSPVSLTFDNVTGSGETTVTSSEVGQGGGPPPPRNFRLGSPPSSFNLETTATFSGPVEICIDYSGVSYGNESQLELLHFEDGDWVVVTTSQDTVNDIICGSVTAFSPFLVAESNVAPVVIAVTLPSDPVLVNDDVSIAASFSDENPGDVHTASIDWGDGAITAGVVNQAAGSVAGSHAYPVAGVYTVTVTVTEDMDPGFDLFGSRSSAEETTNTFIVAYDPNGGFVTGGGWFDSPLGAYKPDESLIGKANFGFVSKYKKGASVPTGNTEFQFKAGDLNFHSSSYEFLVITMGGTNAQYKGSGTVNGLLAPTGDEFKFMLWARDDSPDTFRIKIWYEDGGEVLVYDNGFDQAIGGGSIVIHTE